MNGETAAQPRVFGGSDPGKRSWLRAMARGFRKKCPECGVGRIFDGYVRTQAICDHCGLNISGHAADDAPPYITIMIVGHLAIPLALAAKQIFDPPLTLQFAVWMPLMLAMTAWLLPAVKGGLIGLQWANRMHGFAGATPAVADRG
ncbi:MAG: DUF983 domain-containing protein [Pseudomonadota bacterium]|nr:DUF983 domain-containing protein [Pseudomonadota bacterium]